MKKILGTLAVALLAAACSGGGDGQDDDRAASSSTTATTVKTATISQVASVIAKNESDVREILETGKQCFLAYSSPLCDVAGKLAILSLSFKTEAFEIELRAFREDKPNNQLYVGEYPEEVRRITYETLEAFDAVQAAQKDLTDACAAPMSDVCTQASFRMSQASDDVDDALDSWAPYL